MPSGGDKVAIAIPILYPEDEQRLINLAKRNRRALADHYQYKCPNCGRDIIVPTTRVFKCLHCGTKIYFKG